MNYLECGAVAVRLAQSKVSDIAKSVFGRKLSSSHLASGLRVEFGK
ncbi:MAG: hypothetical protein OXC54_06960 [Rhodospirillaceae bacterium]|nr:hypothetical protein [Rhodospirillaceae bacterium]